MHGFSEGELVDLNRASVDFHLNRSNALLRRGKKRRNDENGLASRGDCGVVSVNSGALSCW